MFLELLKRFIKRKDKPIKENTIQQNIIYNFDRLKKSGNTYSFSGSVPFESVHRLKDDTINKVFRFAYDMAYTDKGHHRNHRSGGENRRKNGEIFANTFQGKLAECAACNFFCKYDKTIQPDFSVEGVGEWDSVDLSVLGKEIAIKSTKHFGQLLLLETKDWDNKGRYIPNLKKGTAKYDYIILVRITPSCEDLMKSKRWLYSDEMNRTELEELVKKENWCYDYAGYITYDEFLYIINNNYVLPKGAWLNGKTKMDAENYYVQAYNMKKLDKIFDKEEKADVL